MNITTFPFLVTNAEYRAAVSELCFFIKYESDNLIRNGWSYELSDNAPESFGQLFESTIDKRILVSPTGSDTSIYGSEINTMFRFWHDMLHLSLCADFSKEGELEVVKAHMLAAKRANLSDLATLILYADTAGQVIYYHQNDGAFVVNQSEFIAHYVDEALRRKWQYFLTCPEDIVREVSKVCRPVACEPKPEPAATLFTYHVFLNGGYLDITSILELNQPDFKSAVNTAQALLRSKPALDGFDIVGITRK